jgi:O-antigen/teichoic acid export membrane protein
VFNLILVFGLIFCVFHPLSSILEATENISGYAKMSVIEALLNILLAIYLTTYMGIKGTILSVIISRLFTNGWFLFGEILRVLEYKILDFIKWFVINLLLPLAILLCSVYLISHSSIVSYGSFITQIILLNLYLLCFFILISKKNILKVFRLFF